RSFGSTDSYGLVLVMVVATYVLATALPDRWSATVVPLAQVASVGLALHTSRARRGVLAVAGALGVVAAGAAVVNLVAEHGPGVRPLVFVTAGALYVVAPVAIVRHI